MCYNNKEIVAELLSCRDILLDITESSDGMTGLHAACDSNQVESARLFLAHPACTKHIVTMLDKEGSTAEMIANTYGHQDCVRMIKEFIDKEETKEDNQRLKKRLRLGDVGVEPVMLEGRTLTQIGDAIEKITAMEQTMEGQPQPQQEMI